jgi:hypothetical protein
LLIFATGCTRGKKINAMALEQDARRQHMAGVSQAGVRGFVPPGKQLGTPYISALGETCYEVVDSQFSHQQPVQAICLRSSKWELLPAISASVRMTSYPSANE